MRRRTSLIAAVVAIAVVMTACGSSSGPSSSDTTSAAVQKINVCSDIPYEPFEFEGDGPDGLKYTGFDIELFNSILKSQGLATGEIKVLGFDGILGNLAAKDCDAVVSAMTIKPDRAEKALFSDPYFDGGQSLLVKKDAGIKSLDDLKGKTIGVQSTTTGEDYAKAHTPAGATIKGYDGADGLFSALQAGEIEAILQDYPVNAYRATKDTTVEVAERYDTNEYYGFAFRLDDTALKAKVDAGLKAMKANGTYDALYKQYLKSDAPAELPKPTS